jgi:plasmid stability protein
VAVRTQIYLPEDLHHRLKSRARLLNRPMADQIREAVTRYLETHEGARAEADDPIWSLPDHAVAGPPDNVAVRHDEILYGWKKDRRTRGRRRTGSRRKKPR